MPATPTASYTNSHGTVVERWNHNDPNDRHHVERITVKVKRTADAPPVLTRMWLYRTTAEADAAWSALVPSNVTPLRRPRRTKK